MFPRPLPWVHDERHDHCALAVCWSVLARREDRRRDRKVQIMGQVRRDFLPSRTSMTLRIWMRLDGFEVTAPREPGRLDKVAPGFAVRRWPVNHPSLVLGLDPLVVGDREPTPLVPDLCRCRQHPRWWRIGEVVSTQMRDAWGLPHIPYLFCG